MAPDTHRLNGFYRDRLDAMGGDGPRAVLLTGPDRAAKRALAEYLAAKAGVRLCPFGTRMAVVRRGPEIAADCVARLRDGAVVFLDMDGADGAEARRLADGIALAGAGAPAFMLVACLDADEPPAALAAAFPLAGRLDESGFSALEMSPSPVP